MLFNSFAFALFFPAVTLLYFLLPHRARWVLLLGASTLFYMYFVPAYVLILAGTILVDYAAGLIELDVVAMPRRFQDTAAGSELDFFIRFGQGLFPDHMSRSQRGMPAEIDFHLGREPAQLEARRGLPDEERCLGKVHLRGNALQPAGLLPGRQEADGGRIAGKRPIGERVNMKQGNGHKSQVLFA
jgi:hypothetical protein